MRRRTYLSASCLDECQQSAEVGSSLLSGPASSVVDQFGGIAQAEFLPNVHAVRVHSLDAQMQNVGNIMRFFSLPKETIHLEFAVRQRGN